MERRRNMNNGRPVPQTIVLHTIPWEELMPGVMRRLIWAQPTWNQPTIPREISMVRFAPGVKVPLHRHVGGDEIVYVIEGVLSDEFGDISAGNVGYRPEGCVHSLHTLNGATIVSYLTGRSVSVSERPSDSPPSRIINVNAMAWQAAEGGRVQLKMIWSDQASDRRCVLGKLAPGMVMPPHEHVGEEFVLQIEGAFVDEGGTVSPGCVGYRPYKCHHSFTSENGGIALGYIWGQSVHL
jgi:anti-sigma factor ChrR (cupin superfamily)